VLLNGLVIVQPSWAVALEVEGSISSGGGLKDVAEVRSTLDLLKGRGRIGCHAESRCCRLGTGIY